MNEQKPSTQNNDSLNDASSQKQTGFKQMDLTIAYRALIQSFVQSDEISIAEIETEKHDEKVYDNS